MPTRFLPLTLFCFGLLAAQTPSPSQLERDRAAIEALHARDAAAAKIGDAATLASLWTSDGVALPPGEAPVVGIETIRAWLLKDQPDPSKVEIVEYVMDFREVQIFGDEAFEWARTHVTVRPKGAPAGLRSSGNLMRLLKRQPDGSWKVARATWNMERPAPESPAGPRKE